MEDLGVWQSGYRNLRIPIMCEHHAEAGLTYVLEGHPDGWETPSRPRIVITGAGQPVPAPPGSSSNGQPGRAGASPPSMVSLGPPGTQQVPWAGGRRNGGTSVGQSSELQPRVLRRPR